MSWKSTLLQLFLFAGTYASVIPKPHHERSGQVNWGPCGLDDPSLGCGNLTVPMDYTDPSSHTTINLQLLKVPAIRTPKKGSILFNFGGPGLEARMSLAGQAKRLLGLTGGEYDLIAHDPRGTADTFTASCFNSTQARIDATAALGDIVRPEDTALLGKLWGGAQVLGNICYNYPGFREKGSLIGTAFTARDIMRIVDAVEDDGLLRYYGFSYGTALGATIAAMFPDRIDRIILDGCVNPHQYYHGYDVELWADTDLVFSSFIRECLKAPTRCGFSHRNSTAKHIERDFYDLIDDLRVEPLVYGQTVIDPTFVLTFIRISLYGPGNYADLSIALNALLTGHLATFMKIYDAHMAGIIESLATDDSPIAIQCGDKKAPQQTLEELGPVFQDFAHESRLLGGAGIPVAMTCANWKTPAKERYQGNFDVTTKHPMLVIGNTYDSVTPLRSAQNISAGFQNSVLLQHGGFGHASLAQGSACTAKAIRKYFVEGTLPEEGTICETSYGPFEPKTLDDVLEDIGFTSSK